MLDLAVRASYSAVLLVLLIGSHAYSAGAALQTYDYSVLDSTFGRIGTFRENIEQQNGQISLRSELHIVVTIAGIVVHRESAYSNAVLQGQWLRSLHAATIVNGTREEISGEDRRGSFVVTSNAGTKTISGEVSPSDPWALKGLGRGEVVSTRTGAVYEATISGGEPAELAMPGAATPVRHFRVDAPRDPGRFDVWLDANGIPVKFSTHERSRLITFELVSSSPREESSSSAKPENNEAASG